MRTAAVGALMLAMAASGRSVHAQLMPAEWIGVRAPSGGSPVCSIDPSPNAAPPELTHTCPSTALSATSALRPHFGHFVLPRRFLKAAVD